MQMNQFASVRGNYRICTEGCWNSYNYQWINSIKKIMQGPIITDAPNLEELGKRGTN